MTPDITLTKDFALWAAKGKVIVGKNITVAHNIPFLFLLFWHVTNNIPFIPQIIPIKW